MKSTASVLIALMTAVVDAFTSCASFATVIIIFHYLTRHKVMKRGAKTTLTLIVNTHLFLSLYTGSRVLVSLDTILGHLYSYSFLERWCMPGMFCVILLIANLFYVLADQVGISSFRLGDLFIARLDFTDV